MDFLSAAYQETANKAGNIDAQIALVEVKRDNIQGSTNVVYTSEEGIYYYMRPLADLRAGLSS